MYDHLLQQYAPDAKPVAHGNLLTWDVPQDEIIALCVRLHVTEGLPLKTIAAFDERASNGSFKIMYVFGIPKEHVFLAPAIAAHDAFPSLTPALHQASIYERKIMSMFGLTPKDHPDPRSLILHDENWPKGVFPLRKDFMWDERPVGANGQFEFRKVDGEGIYEIPVGPVHAGIIEPGHFRFSVAGEEIMLLEPRLGYSHKGSEKLFEVLPLDTKLLLSERISGDSSCSHSMAFCQAVEQLSGINLPERARILRVIYAELERLANHFGDIGAIMTDTGFNFGGAHGARLREIIMQANERLAGSRFLRGVNRYGGIAKDIGDDAAVHVQEELRILSKDFSEVMEVASNSNSLMERLHHTGILPQRIAKDHGVVGVAGRAVGFGSDARVDFPYAAYDKYPFDIPTETSCDVYARYMVRAREVATSFDILNRALADLPAVRGEIVADALPPLKKNAYAIGMVEGWRGDIVYVVSTDQEGAISRVDVRDPSFLNWTALGHAGRGNMVPDFPLINKSFNLSYSGNDV